MKHMIVLSLCFCFALKVCAQKSIDEKIYSGYLNDTIHYTVWLPSDWSAKQKYITIYTFSYGASDAAFTAYEMQYLDMLHITHIPPTIVINIRANMDMMGYNYETGLLTTKGINMVDCIRKEIVPVIEHTYNACGFRVYMGQSYGASYGNYLFLHQPDLFSGYILMSPEQLSPGKPPFEITPGLVRFYNNRTTFYFLASGAYDMQRRQDYAKDISEKLKALDEHTFFFEYKNLADAGHNNSMAIGLPSALEFIFRQYNSMPATDSTTTLLSSIQEYEKNVLDVCGILPAKNSFDIYQPFLSLAWQRHDTTGMMDAIAYFINDSSTGRQLRDFAYSCTVVGLNGKAQELYERAIRKILRDEMTTDFGPSALITCYREMALNILHDDPVEGWDLLEKALKVCLDNKSNIHIGYYPDIYFYMGKFAVDNRFNIKKGLAYLLEYEKMRKDLVDIIHPGFDILYYDIGKAYFLLNDIEHAKQYLAKALSYNSNDENVKNLLQEIQGKK